MSNSTGYSEDSLLQAIKDKPFSAKKDVILEYGSNNANSLIPILSDLVEELEKRPLLDKVWAALLNTFQTDDACLDPFLDRLCNEANVQNFFCLDYLRFLVAIAWHTSLISNTQKIFDCFATIVRSDFVIWTEMPLQGQLLQAMNIVKDKIPRKAILTHYHNSLKYSIFQSCCTTGTGHVQPAKVINGRTLGAMKKISATNLTAYLNLIRWSAGKSCKKGIFTPEFQLCLKVPIKGKPRSTEQITATATASNAIVSNKPITSFSSKGICNSNRITFSNKIEFGVNNKTASASAIIDSLSSPIDSSLQPQSSQQQMSADGVITTTASSSSSKKGLLPTFVFTTVSRSMKSLFTLPKPPPDFVPYPVLLSEPIIIQQQPSYQMSYYEQQQEEYYMSPPPLMEFDILAPIEFKNSNNHTTNGEGSGIGGCRRTSTAAVLGFTPVVDVLAPIDYSIRTAWRDGLKNSKEEDKKEEEEGDDKDKDIIGSGKRTSTLQAASAKIKQQENNSTREVVSSISSSSTAAVVVDTAVVKSTTTLIEKCPNKTSDNSNNDNQRNYSSSVGYGWGMSNNNNNNNNNDNRDSYYTPCTDPLTPLFFSSSSKGYSATTDGMAGTSFTTITPVIDILAPIDYSRANTNTSNNNSSGWGATNKTSSSKRLQTSSRISTTATVSIESNNAKANVKKVEDVLIVEDFNDSNTSTKPVVASSSAAVTASEATTTSTATPPATLIRKSSVSVTPLDLTAIHNRTTKQSSSSSSSSSKNNNTVPAVGAGTLTVIATVNTTPANTSTTTIPESSKTPSVVTTTMTAAATTVTITNNDYNTDRDMIISGSNSHTTSSKNINNNNNNDNNNNNNNNNNNSTNDYHNHNYNTTSSSWPEPISDPLAPLFFSSSSKGYSATTGGMSGTKITTITPVIDILAPIDYSKNKKQRPSPTKPSSSTTSNNNNNNNNDKYNSTSNNTVAPSARGVLDVAFQSLFASRKSVVQVTPSDSNELCI